MSWILLYSSFNNTLGLSLFRGSQGEELPSKNESDGKHSFIFISNISCMRRERSVLHNEMLDENNTTYLCSVFDILAKYKR